MGDGEGVNSDAMQRMSTEFGATQSSALNKPPAFSAIPQLEIPQTRARHFGSFSHNFPARAPLNPPHHNQMPPISPYSQIPKQYGLQSFHSRSLSQPSAAFSFDLLPPLSPAALHTSPDPVPADVAMEDKEAMTACNLPPSSSFGKGNFRASDSLPPRKAHRRSISDIPPGFLSGVPSSGREKGTAMVKREWEKGVESSAEGDVVDDLFNAYMNLDNIDMLNSSDDKTGNETRDDVDSSRASGTKTACESSENEAESSVNENGTERKERVKRSASGGIAPTNRHYRSVSMDSFVGKLKINDESPKFPASKLSPTNSIDDNAFSLDFGSGEFSGAELKKIMANEKLAEIALADPKRAKRILANRQSAARSKERKMRYISELEHKVQTLQTEATTLSAQLTLLQRDSIGLTNQNNELKFRLQAMEQQAHLRDALNEALAAEVRRLKLATAEMGDSSNPSKTMIHMYQMQQQQQQAKQHNADADASQ